jgi:hypothetical protein
MKKSFLFLSVLGFLVLGCGGGSSSNVSSVSIPNWFINSPQNSATSIYGAGSGYNLKEAKASALNDMASRLVVSVSSKINTSKKTSSGSYGSSYEKDTKQNIELEVKSIKFQNAKVTNNALIGGEFYVVMEANRHEVFGEKKKEFDSLDRDIEKRYQNASSLKPLEKIGALESIVPNITKAKNKSYVLNALDSGFNITKLENKYNDYILEISKEKSTLVLGVKSNSDVFKSEFLSFLSSNGYKTGSNANSFVTIKNQNQFSEFRGWHISKSITSIDSVSSGKSVSSSVVKSTGRSSSSKESAYVSSSRSFAKSLKKIGINKILFGK